MSFPFPAPTRLALAALLACAAAAHAETVDVTVDGALPWVGYANVYERPTGGADRGDYESGFFCEEWRIGELPASVKGNQVALSPNSSLGGAPASGSSFWATDGNGVPQPNRVIESNVYIDTGFSGVVLGGKTVRFTGTTVASDLASPYVASPYVAYAFIRDFAPGYGDGFKESKVALVAGQPFEVTLGTEIGHPVQYGVALVGPNANPLTVADLGSITISAVPEPATPAMLLVGAVAMLGWTRRQR